MISLLRVIIFQIDLEIRAAPVPDNANMEINVSPLSEQSDNPDFFLMTIAISLFSSFLYFSALLLAVPILAMQ